MLIIYNQLPGKGFIVKKYLHNKNIILINFLYKYNFIRPIIIFYKDYIVFQVINSAWKKRSFNFLFFFSLRIFLRDLILIFLHTLFHFHSFFVILRILMVLHCMAKFWHTERWTDGRYSYYNIDNWLIGRFLKKYLIKYFEKIVLLYLEWFIHNIHI